VRNFSEKKIFVLTYTRKHEILYYILHLPIQPQNIMLNSGRDFNMHRLTTFKKFIWAIDSYVANNCTRLKKCLLCYYTAYKKKFV